LSTTATARGVEHGAARIEATAEAHHSGAFQWMK